MGSKELAVDYLHPEKSTSVDSIAFGRNYFSTCSSDPEKSLEESEERAQILADLSMLKKQASFYLQPEAKVQSITSSRCYFDRASAPDVLSKDESDAQESLEESEERAQILADLLMLKEQASAYLQPE